MKNGSVVRFVVTSLLAVLPASPSAAGGGKDATADLTALSLEDLMNVEVRSVSRKDQTLARAPAAVFVINQDDIRRSGATSIPELLRIVPGLQVARISSSQWAVSARGFNSRVADKMLVMIDGRSVYNNLYSGVYWDQNDVMFEDIEKIEVIRGPGATMWGANAVNGVINVITKKAKDTQGGLVAAEAGRNERAGAAFRYGGHDGDNLYYRLYSKSFDRAPMQHADGSAAYDGWGATRGGGRLDWQASDRDSVTVQGDTYYGKAHQELNPTAPYDTGVNIPDRINFSGGYALGRWERRLSHSDFSFQTYYNREARTETMGAGTLHTVDFDFQHHLPIGARQDLVWGGGYRRMEDHLDRNHTPFARCSYGDNLFSAFLRDDISLVPDRLVLTLGSKFQHNSFTGLEIQPGAQMLWAPTQAQSIWTSVSRAVRSPSVQDRDLNMAIPFVSPDGIPILSLWYGNPNFRSEVLRAYEAGYRRQLSSRVAIDVAVFVNRYSDLQSVAQLTPYMDSASPAMVVPYAYANSLRGTTYGVETSASWDATGRWRLQASHGWLNGSLNYHNLVGIPWISNPDLQSPRNTLDLRSSWNTTRRWSVDASMYHVSRIASTGVPRRFTVNVHTAYKLGESAEVSAGVDDLFDARHTEFVPGDYVGYSQIPRSAYVKLLWRF